MVRWAGGQLGRWAVGQEFTLGGQAMPWQCCRGQWALEGQQEPEGTGASSPLGQNWGTCSQGGSFIYRGLKVD